MLRRVSCSAVLPTATLASVRFAGEAPKVEKRSKMQTLHKILTGEISFKNKALVKECNVELMFGKGWKDELKTYAAGLPAAEKEVLLRQQSRLSLTRFTTRELGDFAANGPANVDAAAEKANIASGLKLFTQKGEAEFVRVTKEEAAIANWTEESVNKFIASVKKAKAN